MLNTPAPFGQVGSWVLYEPPGIVHAARILSLGEEDGEKVATISLADVPFASSGQPTVRLDKLIDPTPLSAEEMAEKGRLEAYLVGLSHPGRSVRSARHTALLERARRASQLVELLTKLNKTRLATRATREGQRFFEALVATPSLSRATCGRIAA